MKRRGFLSTLLAGVAAGFLRAAPIRAEETPQLQPAPLPEWRELDWLEADPFPRTADIQDWLTPHGEIVRGWDVGAAPPRTPLTLMYGDRLFIFDKSHCYFSELVEPTKFKRVCISDKPLSPYKHGLSPIVFLSHPFDKPKTK